MARAIPDEEAIREAAAESSYTAEEVEEAAKVVHDAVQSNLYDHYESAINSGGTDNLLYEIGQEVLFALHPHAIVREVREYGSELESGVILAAVDASLIDFQNNDRTIAIAGTTARTLDPPMLYPIRAEKSEEWVRGEAHAMQMFEAYTSRAEMSAAEALDYWATVKMGKRPDEWGSYRNVGSEAVRKNQRQARDKISENGLGSGYENNEVRAVKREDVPDDGVYDEEADQYFVPFDGVLRSKDDRE